MNEIGYSPLITTGGLIIIAIISAWSTVQVATIARGRKDMKAIRAQVENDHSNGESYTDNGVKKIPNLRENIDRNHDILMETVAGIADTQRRQSNKIDRLFSMSHKQSEEITKLRKGETND